LAAITCVSPIAADGDIDADEFSVDWRAYRALDSRTTARRAPLRLFNRRTPEARSLGEIKPGARRPGVDLR